METCPQEVSGYILRTAQHPTSCHFSISCITIKLIYAYICYISNLEKIFSKKQTFSQQNQYNHFIKRDFLVITVNFQNLKMKILKIPCQICPKLNFANFDRQNFFFNSKKFTAYLHAAANYLVYIL